MASAPQTPPQPRTSRGKTQNNSVAIAIVAIVLLFAIMLIRNSGLLNKTTWDHDDWDAPDWSDSDWDSNPEPVTPDDNYRDIDANCGDEIDINDDLTIQFLGYTTDDGGQVYVLYWASDYDLAKSLLESGFVMLSDSAEDSGYPADSVGDGYVYFNTFSPGTQWQTLDIYGSTAGDRITIHNLLPHEGVDLSDYDIPTTAYSA